MTLPGQNADVVAAATPGGAGGFRGRVEQRVDAITGSANRVLSGVVDSSFGVLRSILPIAGISDGSAALASADGGEEGLAASAPWNISRPGFGLLRRESGFSIASLAASLPGASGMRDRARSFASVHSGVGGGGGGGGAEEEGQEMVESRPGSVKGVSLREESEESGEGEEEDVMKMRKKLNDALRMQSELQLRLKEVTNISNIYNTPTTNNNNNSNKKT